MVGTVQLVNEFEDGSATGSEPARPSTASEKQTVTLSQL